MSDSPQMKVEFAMWLAVTRLSGLGMPTKYFDQASAALANGEVLVLHRTGNQLHCHIMPPILPTHSVFYILSQDWLPD